VLIFNLTDVETPALLSRGLVNATVSVRGVVIQPGESADVPGGNQAKWLIGAGAISVGEPPKEYLEAKAKMVSQKPTEVPPPTDPPPETPPPPEDPSEDPPAEPPEERAEPKSEKPKKKKRGGRNR
jgi:hypothetical protein